MKEKRVNYNAKTGETEIIEVIVEEIINELPIEIQPTIEEKIEKLENTINSIKKVLEKLNIIKEE